MAGIWIDPNGCDHWIIDDGIEGYLSQRVDPYGKPVCTGHGAETSGPFKEGSKLTETQPSELVQAAISDDMSFNQTKKGRSGNAAAYLLSSDNIRECQKLFTCTLSRCLAA